jgi:hypothetical protein
MNLYIISWLSVLGKSDILLYGLEDETEEVSYYYIISEPKLDLFVHTARSYECFVEACNVVSSYNQDSAFLWPYTINNVQESG